MWTPLTRPRPAGTWRSGPPAQGSLPAGPQITSRVLDRGSAPDDVLKTKAVALHKLGAIFRVRGPCAAEPVLQTRAVTLLSLLLDCWTVLGCAKGCSGQLKVLHLAQTVLKVSAV